MQQTRDHTAAPGLGVTRLRSQRLPSHGLSTTPSPSPRCMRAMKIRISMEIQSSSKSGPPLLGPLGPSRSLSRCLFFFFLALPQPPSPRGGQRVALGPAVHDPRACACALVPLSSATAGHMQLQVRRLRYSAATLTPWPRLALRSFDSGQNSEKKLLYSFKGPYRKKRVLNRPSARPPRRAPRHYFLGASTQPARALLLKSPHGSMSFPVRLCPPQAPRLCGRRGGDGRSSSPPQAHEFPHARGLRLLVLCAYSQGFRLRV